MAIRPEVGRFRADERGTVAVLFGLVLVVLTFAAGMGV